MIPTCTTTVETCRKSWQMRSWDMCKKCWKAFPTWTVASDSNVALAVFFGVKNCEVVWVWWLWRGSFKWEGGSWWCLSTLIRFSKKGSLYPTIYMDFSQQKYQVGLISSYLPESLDYPESKWSFARNRSTWWTRPSMWIYQESSEIYDRWSGFDKWNDQLVVKIHSWTPTRGYSTLSIFCPLS